MTEKSQGNFLYVKFVMDAVLEKKKFDFTIEEVDTKISGIYGIVQIFSLTEWFFSMEKTNGICTMFLS